MISRTEEQMLVYNARLEQQRDEEARTVQAVVQARMEGDAAGEIRGRLRGQIGLLQKLLGQRVWAPEEVAAFDLAQLKATSAQLEQESETRNS